MLICKMRLREKVKKSMENNNILYDLLGFSPLKLTIQSFLISKNSEVMKISNEYGLNGIIVQLENSKNDNLENLPIFSFIGVSSNPFGSDEIIIQNKEKIKNELYAIMDEMLEPVETEEDRQQVERKEQLKKEIKLEHLNEIISLLKQTIDDLLDDYKNNLEKIKEIKKQIDEFENEKKKLL